MQDPREMFRYARPVRYPIEKKPSLFSPGKAVLLTPSTIPEDTLTRLTNILVAAGKYSRREARNKIMILLKNQEHQQKERERMKRKKWDKDRVRRLRHINGIP